MGFQKLLRLICAALISACTFCCVVEAGDVFPPAKGFGTDTEAGRGGRVIRVTNLDSSEPGSLRDALNANGRRIVVFEVAGVIDLGCENLYVREAFLTIAGQTAPSPGITIIRGGIEIGSHDVLVQHIRVRPGDAGRAKRSGWEVDGIATSAAYNVVIDHCSISWAVDENLSASGPRLKGPAATSHDITFSHCIIAEALSDSSHAKGPHSKGSLIHDNCTNIAVIANLYAHNVERNPYFKACTTGVIVNNLIYNPGRHAIKVQYSDGEWRKSKTRRPENARLSIVGNVLVHGVNTDKALPLVGRAGGRGKGDLYLEDNIAKLRSGEDADIFVEPYRILNEKPLWPERLMALAAKDVIAYVTANAGARPKDRDEIDHRIIRQFHDRSGRIIDSQDQVGGYPQVEMVRRPLKVPDEDIDGWLAQFTALVQ